MCNRGYINLSTLYITWKWDQIDLIISGINSSLTILAPVEGVVVAGGGGGIGHL